MPNGSCPTRSIISKTSLNLSEREAKELAIKLWNEGHYVKRSYEDVEPILYNALKRAELAEAGLAAYKTLPWYKKIFG